jgi:flagellar hook assembly protein FlgD
VSDGEVRFAPNPFARNAGDGAVHVHLVVPAAAVGYELRIFDLWGRVVRDLGGDDLGPGPRETVWDGRDEAGHALPAGGYVAAVLWRDEGGAAWPATRRLVVIREGGP